MDIVTNTYLSATEQDAAIEEYNKIREVGEASGTTSATIMETNRSEPVEEHRGKHEQGQAASAQVQEVPQIFCRISHR